MRFSVDLQQRAKAMPDSTACVVVIDDDLEFRESLGRLLRSVGLDPHLFASIADFLGSEPARWPYLSGPRCEVAGAEWAGFSA